jgi:hypothetical protein
MARFDKGWIRIDRKLLTSDLFDDTYLFCIWLTLLLMANVKQSKIKWGTIQRVLEPGQLVTGTVELSKKTNIPRSCCHRALKYLSDTGRIRKDSGKLGTIVTICKWTDYQLLQNDDGTYEERSGDDQGTIEERSRHISRQRTKNKEQEEEELREEGRELENSNSAPSTIPKQELSSIHTDPEPELISAPTPDAPAPEKPKQPRGAIPELDATEFREMLMDVSQKSQQLWIKTYSDSEWIKNEFLKALAWCENNPRKRPKKSWGQFLNNWLTRGEEFRRRSTPSNPSGQRGGFKPYSQQAYDTTMQAGINLGLFGDKKNGNPDQN